MRLWVEGGGPCLNETAGQQVVFVTSIDSKMLHRMLDVWSTMSD